MLISFLTGTFVQLFTILLIVLLHELGHFMAAKRFHWHVNDITLWVFGGVMQTDEHGIKNIFEEAIVTLAGPFQHLLIYAAIQFLLSVNIMPASFLQLALEYNTIIFWFNLLPIWPLDGGKLLFLCLSAIFPYRKAYHSIIIFSIIGSLSLLIFQLFFYSFTLSAFLIMIFLVMENRDEWKQRYYVFIRFLLKRYQAQHVVRKRSLIVVPPQLSLMDVFARFKREIKHDIYINFPYDLPLIVDENVCLQMYFGEKRFQQSIGELVKDHR